MVFDNKLSSNGTLVYTFYMFHFITMFIWTDNNRSLTHIFSLSEKN